MDSQSIRAILENRQIGIYFGTVVVAGISALLLPGTTTLEAGVNPALALMLFVTFLQVPLADLRQHFARLDFLAALLIANFIAVPLLVAALVQLLPAGSAMEATLTTQAAAITTSTRNAQSSQSSNSSALLVESGSPLN